MKRQSKEISQFEADYLVLQPAMQRMAERLLGNEDEAADVVQDCFVTLWSERESLKRVLNHEAWCITLVKHRSVELCGVAVPRSASTPLPSFPTMVSISQSPKRDLES